MKKMYQRGFTLIELLVVIAIIGLLAAVVLAAVGSARQKGGDAAVKSDLDAMRSQAEIVASNNNNSYKTASASVCTDTTIVNQLKNAYAATGGTYTLSCQNDATTWAAYAPLNAGGNFCVDSTGAATTTNNASPITAATPFKCQ